MWSPASSVMGARPKRREFVEIPVTSWRSFTKFSRYGSSVSTTTSIGMILVNRRGPPGQGASLRSTGTRTLPVKTASATKPALLRQTKSRSPGLMSPPRKRPAGRPQRPTSLQRAQLRGSLCEMPPTNEATAERYTAAFRGWSVQPALGFRGKIRNYPEVETYPQQPRRVPQSAGECDVGGAKAHQRVEAARRRAEDAPAAVRP